VIYFVSTTRTPVFKERGPKASTSRTLINRKSSKGINYEDTYPQEEAQRYQFQGHRKMTKGDSLEDTSSQLVGRRTPRAEGVDSQVPRETKNHSRKNMNYRGRVISLKGKSSRNCTNTYTSVKMSKKNNYVKKNYPPP
jgi:hypothetical protein